MIDRTDVFVVGGGPAGLAAATAVRRKGFNVIVADGRHPPIDKACGEGLMPDALSVLRELGVELNASDGYAIRGVRFVGGAHEVAASFPAGHGTGIKRRVLHRKLVEQAEEHGVSLLWNTPARGVCPGGVLLKDRVVSAKWIIGADGIRSRMRAWIGLDASGEHECRYAFRRHYWIAPWSDFMEVHWGQDAQAYVTPVGDDEICVVLISRQPNLRFTSIEALFPRLAQRLQRAAHSGTDRGAITVTRRLERVYRGSAALIGDASGSVDAVTGEGLRLSFQQSAALADALEAGDLESYQKAHRLLARRPALMGRAMLLLDGRPLLRERVLQALAGDPAIFSRLLAVHVGAQAAVHLGAAGARLGWRLLAA